MKTSNNFVLSLLLFLLSTEFSRSEDITLVSGATGSAVVEACVTKILKSGVFSEDYNFLRNLAYVETLDGTDMDSGETGGIWKVSSTVFDQLADSTLDVASYYDAINSSFEIEWETVQYDSLTIPLYSALAQRLYMAYLEREEWISNIKSTTVQGLYWARNISDSEETIFYYMQAVKAIQTGCIQPQRDIVFLIDSSLENEEDYLTTTKELIEDIVKQLKIDGNLGNTVVGLAQFSNSLQVLSYLNGSASEVDVLASLSSAESLSNGKHTGLFAGTVMSDFFTTDNGAKGWSTGTPQVLCVLLAGESDDSITNIASTASEKAVNVIAIGMTADVTKEHVGNISTGVDSAFLRRSFSSSAELEYAVARQICSETGLIPSGQRQITGVVKPNEASSLTLTVPAEGIESNIMTSSGTLDMYYSAFIKSPSSAYYDYRLEVPSPNQKVELNYVPTAAELRHHGDVTVNLYITLQSTSDLPVEFTITIGSDDNEEPITITVNITTNTSTEAPASSISASGLSAGEIAGIVFSCLILVCAVLVAIVYFRFGKPGGRKPLMHRDELDRPMDSSEATVAAAVAAAAAAAAAASAFAEAAVDAVKKDAYHANTTTATTATKTTKGGKARVKAEIDEDQAKRLETNVRERLQSAVRRRDIPNLSDAVEDFMALKLEDHTGDFVKAQRMIAVHQCKQGNIHREDRGTCSTSRSICAFRFPCLREIKHSKSTTASPRWTPSNAPHGDSNGLTYAINQRNLKILEKAIFKGKRMEYDVELKMELVNAEILLQDLKKTDNLLRRLKRAMNDGDIAVMEAITAELRVLKGCDQATVDRMLHAFQLREDIEEAMLRRDINGINESISRIEEKGLERDLAAELRQARKMAKDLAIVEKARNEVMGLKQSRVSEIKSYATPPPGVHEVMMSVYLLLGYHPTQLQSWTAIQALMGKTGREGLRRLIGELELTSVDVMHGRMAKSLLDNFDLTHIREISEALAVFYIFSRSVVKEAEKLLPEGDQDNGSHSDILDESDNVSGMMYSILR